LDGKKIGEFCKLFVKQKMVEIEKNRERLTYVIIFTGLSVCWYVYGRPM